VHYAAQNCFGETPGLQMPATTYFKTDFFVILNEVNDLNLLKLQDSSLRSE